MESFWKASKNLFLFTSLSAITLVGVIIGIAYIFIIIGLVIFFGNNSPFISENTFNLIFLIILMLSVISGLYIVFRIALNDVSKKFPSSKTNKFLLASAYTFTSFVFTVVLTTFLLLNQNIIETSAGEDSYLKVALLLATLLFIGSFSLNTWLLQKEY